MAIDNKFIQEIQTLLLEEEKRLKNELDDFTVKTDHGNEAAFPDFGDKSGENASEVASFDNDISLKKVLESSLRDVRSALKSLTSGSYGICKYCGKEIDKSRLKVRPTSSSCIECKKSFSK